MSFHPLYKGGVKKKQQIYTWFRYRRARSDACEMMQKWCNEHPDNLNPDENDKQRFVKEGIRTPEVSCRSIKVIFFA